MSEYLLPYIQQIDALIESAPPGDLSIVRPFFENPTLDRYLFGHLHRSDWLPPLYAAGLLNSEALKHHPYRMSYILYLAQEFPESAAEVLHYAHVSEPEAQGYFIAILKILPEDLLASLLPEMERWKQSGSDSQFSSAIQDLAEWSLEHTDSPVIPQFLLRFLLSPVPQLENNYRPFSTTADDTQFQFFLEAHREQLIQTSWFIPLLIDLLGQYASIRAQKPYSMHDPNASQHLGRRSYLSLGSIDETLVAELLRLLPTLPDNPEEFLEFWTLLLKYPYGIFRRLRLLALAAQSSPPQQAVKLALLDRYAFVHDPEYRDAARLHFTKLTAADQKTVWQWVREERNLLSPISGPNQNVTTEAIAYAQWRRLQRVQPHLPEDLRESWIQLSTRYGQEETGGFQMVVREGIPSSVTVAELAQKPIPELVLFLQQPPPPTGDAEFDNQQFRLEGLMQVLRQDVRQRSAEYLAHLEALEALPPVMLSSVISAFRGVEDLPQLPLGSLVRLMHLVARRSRETPDHAWSSCVGWLADLFEDKILTNESLREELQFAPEILAALLDGLNDPEPAAASELDRMLEEDAFTASLNSTRGKVVHALLRWMGWVSEHDGRDAEELLEQGKTALERHLQPDTEQAASVYAAVVRTLPWFHYIDPAYAARLIRVLFDRNRPTTSRPVWSAFLNGTQVYGELFSKMRLLYVAYAGEDLLNPAAAIWSTREEVQRNFGRHVGMLFVLNRITFDDPDRLMANYLAHSEPKAISEAISYLVRSLHNTEGDVSLYVARIQVLWSHVEQAAQDRREDEAQVLRAGFLPLITSDLFDVDWRITQLAALIEAGLPSTALQQTVFRIVKLPSAQLTRVLDLLVLIAEREPTQALAYQTLQLLQRIEETRSEEVDGKVNQLIHAMINAGFIDAFRPFLRGAS